MTRLTRVLAISVAAISVALAAGACGTEKVHIPKSDPHYASDFAGATLFNQRCGGCHTLSYAGTTGSGQNPRTYLSISGPNFNVRCERPAIRVLYAIENGGFSGAFMPQNVVVGQQAREVAMFVARFAGADAAPSNSPGAIPCAQQSIGMLPALQSPAQVDATTVTTTSTTATARAKSQRKHSAA